MGRMYDPAELMPSEHWIPRVFEPVRGAFFGGLNPMEFILPETALPADAEVAVLVGLHAQWGGPFKIVYVFRRLKCVNVYEVISHGRQVRSCRILL